MLLLLILYGCLHTVTVSGFWDDGTSTLGPVRTDKSPRYSFFRWQETRNTWVKWFFPWANWRLFEKNRRTTVIAGMSIDFLCLGTASLLNRRTLITAANILDPWFDRQRDLRVWLLGNAGYYYTPYRYRVWRVTRMFPKSLNPEHWHGARGVHSPRHDISIIHSLDQIFMLNYKSTYGMYPVRCYAHPKHKLISPYIWMGGSGYEYMEHIVQNYKIFWHDIERERIVDCSKFLPKYWGKFICIINTANFPGIQNGMGLHNMAEGWDYLAGLGCFEIRYNEERIMVFTDLRYYTDFIYHYTYIRSGEYYEYAYPHWGISIGILWNTRSANQPNNPHWQVQHDLYPLDSWRSSAHQFFEDIAKRIVDASRDQKAGLLLGQRFCITIQRGNADSVLGTFSIDSDVNDFFDAL